MSFDQNPCTPENIIDITIQYQWQSGVNVPTASIRVDFGSPLRDQLITVPEMLTYVKYLQIKAAALGKSVVAIQYTNFKTVITIGDPPPFDFNKVITFQKDGVNFAGAENLIASFNTTLDNAHQVTSNFNIAMVTFTLPDLTNGQFGFLDQYTPSTLQPFSATTDNTNWTVQYCIITLDNVALNIDFVSTAFQKIVDVNDDFEAGAILYTDAVPDGFVLQQTGANATTYIKKTTALSFSAAGTHGAINLVQKDSLGIVLSSNYSDSWNQNILIDPLCVTIELVAQTVTVFHGVGGALGPFAHPVFCSANNGFSENDAFIAAAASILITVKERKDNFSYCSGKNTTNGTISFLRQGIIEQTAVYTANGDKHDVALIGLAQEYDTVIIDDSGTAFALTARVATVEAGICSTATVTLYKSSPAPIAPADVLFDDAALTIPHAGSNFVVDVSTGQTYNINNVTGVVGAATATVCVPPIDKPIFTLNMTGLVVNAQDVISPASSTNFNIGENKNITFDAQSTFKNNDGAGHTYTFYVSAPFIPANIVQGPTVLAPAATLVLPADISFHNYLTIS